MNASVPPDDQPPDALYLELIKKCLTRDVFGEAYQPVKPRSRVIAWALDIIRRRFFMPRSLRLVRHVRLHPERRAEWGVWPPIEGAETMIGLRRLDNLQYCVTEVLQRSVPGDLIETGVWRGGATIFMRAVLKAYGDTRRVVWVADSFQGFPRPDPERYPADAGDRHCMMPELAVSLEQVKANITRYGLLDEQVRFLPGWFRDTLPNAPIERLAVVRLDSDLYESTMEALRSLYPKVSAGGFVIVDDYGYSPSCRAAVEDFRAEHGITEALEHIDWTGVFWRRLR